MTSRASSRMRRGSINIGSASGLGMRGHWLMRASLESETRRAERLARGTDARGDRTWIDWERECGIWRRMNRDDPMAQLAGCRRTILAVAAAPGLRSDLRPYRLPKAPQSYLEGVCGYMSQIRCPGPALHRRVMGRDRASSNRARASGLTSDLNDQFRLLRLSTFCLCSKLAESNGHKLRRTFSHTGGTSSL